MSKRVPRPSNERLKRPMNEAMAIAHAENAREKMASARGASARGACAIAIDGVEQASLDYGRAAARLHGSHPKMSQAYRLMMADLEKIKERCGGGGR